MNLFNQNIYQQNNILIIIPKNHKYIFLIIFFLFFLFHYYCIKNNINEKNQLSKEKIYFDKYEVFKFNNIKQKFIGNKCSEMWDNQREFLNGIIRKFKPKKILEIGVYRGGVQ